MHPHLKRDTRRFAKRQLTWFRADPEIVWPDSGRTEELVRLSTEFLALADSLATFATFLFSFR